MRFSTASIAFPLEIDTWYAILFWRALFLKSAIPLNSDWSLSAISAKRAPSASTCLAFSFVVCSSFMSAIRFSSLTILIAAACSSNTILDAFASSIMRFSSAAIALPFESDAWYAISLWRAFFLKAAIPLTSFSSISALAATRALSASCDSVSILSICSSFRSAIRFSSISLALRCSSISTIIAAAWSSIMSTFASLLTRVSSASFALPFERDAWYAVLLLSAILLK